MSDPRIHPSSTIGPQVSIGPGVTIGPNCRIVGATTIGARADIREGVALQGNALVGDGCVIGAHVSMAVAPAHDVAEALVLGRGVHIGAGSTLAQSVSIGAYARVGARTVVTGDIPAHGIVEGDPARLVGFGVLAQNAERLVEGADPERRAVASTSVDGVAVYRFPLVSDHRGDLTPVEFDRRFPFRPKRYFLVGGVPDTAFRGGHAHLTCAELLVCVSGSLAVVVDDGITREEIELTTSSVALYLPARVWATQYRHAPGTVLLVFASHHYDETDYIRDYERFLAQADAHRRRRRPGQNR